MKKFIHSLNRTLAIAAMAGVLFSQVMVGEAMAQSTSPACNWGAGEGGGICGNGSTPSTNCTANGSYTQYCAPELSDYLAMALLAMSAGTVYYIRRRKLAVA